jgi:hypothetical protein
VQVTDGRFLINLGPAEMRVFERPQVPLIVGAVTSARAEFDQEIPLELDVIDFDGIGETLTVRTVGTVPGTGAFDSQLGAVNVLIINDPSDDPNDPDTVIYRLTPTSNIVGSQTLTFEVKDSAGKTATHTVQLEILDPAANNTLPTGSLDAPPTAVVDELFTAQVDATDPPGSNAHLQVSGRQRYPGATDYRYDLWSRPSPNRHGDR